MGIFNTILFAIAALAAVMTIFSTIRVYARDFAVVRVQLTNADIAQSIVWRIFDTRPCSQDLQAAPEPKVRSRVSGPMSQDLWALAPLPSLAA